VVAGVGGGVGTLLGPEGAGNCFFSDWSSAGFGWWGVVVRLGSAWRPYRIFWVLVVRGGVGSARSLRTV
jgi:hypothetical protein